MEDSEKDLIAGDAPLPENLQSQDLSNVVGVLEPGFLDGSAKNAEVAPKWHTILLLIFILVISFRGFSGHSFIKNSPREESYFWLVGFDLLLFLWVSFGLWLRRRPLRSIIGRIEWDFDDVARDIGLALLLWLGTLIILLSASKLYDEIQQHLESNSGVTESQQVTPGTDMKNDRAIQMRALARISPTTGMELLGWLCVSLSAGIFEEIVFRGYLQQQFKAWSRGSTVVAVVVTSVLFGAAHGYQGLRGMFLVGLLGLAFGVVREMQKNLRVSAMMHVWQDSIAGFLFFIMQSHHQNL